MASSLRQVSMSVDELTARLDQLQAINDKLDLCLTQLAELQGAVRRLSGLGATQDGLTLGANLGLIRLILEREFGKL